MSATAERRPDGARPSDGRRRPDYNAHTEAEEEAYAAAGRRQSPDSSVSRRAASFLTLTASLSVSRAGTEGGKVSCQGLERPATAVILLGAGVIYGGLLASKDENYSLRADTYNYAHVITNYLHTVALHEVTRCMVVWCTQNAPRWQQFHVAPAMPAL